MKKFITHVFIVVFFVMLLFVGLDVMISRGLQTSRDFRFQTWTDIFQDSIKADVVFLGNSRAAMHYDVATFDSILGCSSYNLGRQGLTGNLTVYPFLIYKETISQLPKLVVYNVDYLTFPEGKMPWMTNLPQIAPYISEGILREKILTNKDWFNNVTLNMYLPFYRYFGYSNDIIEGLKSFCFDYHVSQNEQAYKGFHPIPNSDKVPNLDDVKNLVGFDISKKNARIVEEEIIQWCQDKDIPIILVHSPIYNYDFQYSRAKHIAEFDSVINHYITNYNLLYLDYSQDSMSYKANNFGDLVHMKHHAATQFTIKLANDLDSLGIIH